MLQLFALKPTKSSKQNLVATTATGIDMASRRRGQPNSDNSNPQATAKQTQHATNWTDADSKRFWIKTHSRSREIRDLAARNERTRRSVERRAIGVYLPRNEEISHRLLLTPRRRRRGRFWRGGDEGREENGGRRGQPRSPRPVAGGEAGCTGWEEEEFGDGRAGRNRRSPGRKGGGKRGQLMERKKSVCVFLAAQCGVGPPTQGTCDEQVIKFIKIKLPPVIKTCILSSK
jgi:hypothetical protein